MMKLPVIASLITPTQNCNDVPCGICSIMYDILFGEELPHCLRVIKSEMYLGLIDLKWVV